MAYRLDANFGYGTGSDGDYSAGTDEVVNNYAKVYYLAANTIKISKTKTLGLAKNKFEAGQEIMIHVAGVASSFTKTECNKRGWWTLAKIVDVPDATTLTLSKNVSDVISGFKIDDLLVQAITIPNFKTLKIDGYKSITCPQFDGDVGGVVAFKCSENLIFNHADIPNTAEKWQYGGTINVLNKGMPSGDYWNYGWIKGENEGEVTHDYGGHHNYRTTRHLTINYPDGAVWLCTKKLTCDHYASIGNGTESIMQTSSRGGIWSMGGSYWFGGSTIFLAAGEIDDVDSFKNMINRLPEMSYSAGARGIPRVYVASETVLPTTELWAYDRISDPTRMSRVFNIKSWGDGSLGDVKNVTKQLNSYASVTAISSNGKKLTLGNIDAKGVAQLTKDALVMIHSTQKDTTNLDCAGKFMVTTISAYSANTITLNDAYNVNVYGNPKDYHVQVIAVPQYQNLTMAKTNSATPKFDNGIGGILALAVSETCDLRDGKFNVGKKGGAVAYGAEGLKQINCGSMAERLPIGEGHGSIFILAQNLIMNNETRLGSFTGRVGDSGVDFGAGGKYFGGINRSLTNYNNHNDARNYPCQVAYNDENSTSLDTTNGHNPQIISKDTKHPTLGITVINHESFHGGAGGASGLGGGRHLRGGHHGGYGSNSTDGACQGAHLLIIADKIEGFCLEAICTGGDGGRIFSNASWNSLKKYLRTGEQGGAGYGGSGGSIGDLGNVKECRGGNGGVVGGGGGCGDSSTWASGGGSGGFCFVYCNKVVNQANDGITRD